MRALILSLSLSAAASAALAPGAAPAQAIVQPLPGTTDADRLAEQMRALAANPRDLTALIAAGELSLGLDDLSAAAALFARADKIDPRNPRAKAGMGSILVRSERPGEALRYFAMADTYGIDSRRIASDRGFAYDLIGEQDRAQRDYRLALATGSGDGTDHDETLRRYALSLGISGRDTQAFVVLDPLLRKNDRGAWRARAFVLAMTGKEAEATRIATTMLPPGMAAGLQPFFDRLPHLPAIDRAFAVHFGEVHTTADRLTDRTMAPRLAALAPEAAAPAVVVAQAPVPTVAPRKPQRGSRTRTSGVELAAAATTTVPAIVALPAPPSYASRPIDTTQLEPLPAPSRTVKGSSATRLANAASLASQSATGTAPVLVPTPASRSAPTVSEPVRFVAIAPAAPAIVRISPAPFVAPPTMVAAAPPVARVETVVAAPIAVAAAPPPPTPPVPSETASRASRVSEDSILARIIAGLSIPASELDVAPPPRAIVHIVPPAPVSAAQVVAEAKAKEARDEAARQVLAERLAADRKAAEKKAVADRKALAAKKLADARKAEDAKAAAEAKAEAAEEKRVARANPARIWVQVSGGAYEGDLAKAWAAVKTKAPTLFAGRQGWTTPLRATNRVLAGPFKTDAEARGFVNQLGKAGVAAFTFSSDAGQSVTRLAGK